METKEHVLEMFASEMEDWDVVESLLNEINEFRISITSKICKHYFSLNHI